MHHWNVLPREQIFTDSHDMNFGSSFAPSGGRAVWGALEEGALVGALEALPSFYPCPPTHVRGGGKGAEAAWWEGSTWEHVCRYRVFLHGCNKSLPWADKYGAQSVGLAEKRMPFAARFVGQHTKRWHLHTYVFQAGCAEGSPNTCIHFITH